MKTRVELTSLSNSSTEAPDLAGAGFVWDLESIIVRS